MAETKTQQQKAEKRDAALKWLKFTAFILVIIGGINLLFMGLFELDLVGGIFGGTESVISRICYSLFGLGAVTLLTVVLVRAFSKNESSAAK